MGWALRVEINFTQKNPELLYLIAALFPGKNLYKSEFKDGRTWFSLTFSSKKEMPFWIHYLSFYHFQSRKYWQFLKIKECFDLMLEAQNSRLASKTLEKKLTPEQKKQARDQLIVKARQLQVELRTIEIPEFVRENIIPMYTSRSSLTLIEMDLIDRYLENSQLSFRQIAEKMNISRGLLYRYRKNPDRYRSKPLIDTGFRRQNTSSGKAWAQTTKKSLNLNFKFVHTYYRNVSASGQTTF